MIARFVRDIVTARWMKFCVVGGSGVMVDMGVFTLIYHLWPTWDISLAKLGSGSCAMVSNFYWNDRWTFRPALGQKHRIEKKYARFLSFAALCGLGLLLCMLVVRLLHLSLGLHPHAANMAAIFTATFWNYFSNKSISWARKNSEFGTNLDTSPFIQEIRKVPEEK